MAHIKKNDRKESVRRTRDTGGHPGRRACEATAECPGAPFYPWARLLVRLAQNVVTVVEEEGALDRLHVEFRELSEHLLEEP